MNAKLIVKLLFLVLIFVSVMAFREYTGSKTFKEGMNYIFGTGGPSNTTHWCVDQVTDLNWVSDQVPDRIKQMPQADLKRHYCELSVEPIVGVDLDKVAWQPLAESNGPTGKKTILEWNKENGVFRAGGMPFKSSNLSLQLQK